MAKFSETNKGGRGKNNPNKTTKRVKQAIAMFTEQHIDKTWDWIEEISHDDPKGAFNCFLSMLEYYVPKMQRVEHTGKDGEAITINNILTAIETPVLPALTDDKELIELTEYESIIDS